MNPLHAIILGNLVVIFFNLIGTCTRMKPPPIWAYAIGWPGVIAVIYFVGAP